MSIRETIEKLKIERQEHVESMMKSSLIMEIEDKQLENALNSLQSRHLKVKNDLVVNGDFILLDFLYALEKGNGYGTSFMKDFIEVADQHNQNILLKLLNRSEENFERLIKFYQKFDFHLDRENGEMYRLPQVQNYTPLLS